MLKTAAHSVHSVKCWRSQTRVQVNIESSMGNFSELAGIPSQAGQKTLSTIHLQFSARTTRFPRRTCPNGQEKITM